MFVFLLNVCAISLYTYVQLRGNRKSISANDNRSQPEEGRGSKPILSFYWHASDSHRLTLNPFIGLFYTILSYIFHENYIAQNLIYNYDTSHCVWNSFQCRWNGPWSIYLFFLIDRTLGNIPLVIIIIDQIASSFLDPKESQSPVPTHTWSVARRNAKGLL